MYGRIESVQELVHSETSVFFRRGVVCPRTFVFVADGPRPLENAVSVGLAASQ
jgi:hypothetical protein